MGRRKKNVSDGGSVNCKDCDTNFVTGKDCAIYCDMCSHWFYGGCVELAEQQIDVLADIFWCKWFCASCPPSITVNSYEENRKKSRPEVKNLESDIRTIENSLEKIEKRSSSPVSYAKMWKVPPSLMTWSFSFRDPPEGTLFIIGNIPYELLSSSMQEKKELNRLFPLITVDCFMVKTGKVVVLFNIAEDCSKSAHRMEKHLFWKSHEDCIRWSI